MEWPEASIILQGERVIDADYFKYDPRRATLSLIPLATANPAALLAIEQADMVVVAPGDLYTSLGPLLIIDGFAEALEKTKALCVYVSNLVTKHGQTTGFTVSDHASEIERFVGVPFLDYVLYNQQIPTKDIALRYVEEDAFLTAVDKDVLARASYKAIPGNFLGEIAPTNYESSILPVTRSLIRHDAEAVANAIISLYNHARE
jgi:uncharacterized cofD-like protein